RAGPRRRSTAPRRAAARVRRRGPRGASSARSRSRSSWHHCAPPCRHGARPLSALWTALPPPCPVVGWTRRATRSAVPSGIGTCDRRSRHETAEVGPDRPVLRTLLAEPRDDRKATRAGGCSFLLVLVQVLTDSSNLR